MDKNILNNIRKECIALLKQEPDRINALAIMHKFNTDILEAVEKDAESKIGNAVLVAMGSFSRMQLTPYSDIDLLIIHKKKEQPDDNIRELVYGFYDTDFDITVSTRTIEETIDVSKYSYKTLFSVFEPKYIAGNQDLFNELVQKFNRKISPNKLIKKIIHGLFFDAEKRQNTNNIVLIPNLKESPGGLRELSVSKMLCKMFHMDFLDAIIKERDFIYLIRSYIHAFAGRSSDVLNEEIAADLGKLIGMSESALRRKVILSLRNGLVLYRGILSDIMGENNKFWSSVLIKRFSETDTQVKTIQDFLSSQTNIEEAFWIRELHKKIPEFQHIEGYVERIGFHVLPVDEHSIQVVKEFYTLMDEIHLKDHTVIRGVAASLDQLDREILLMAMLLHDIGKGRGGGHSEKGKKIAGEILKKEALPESVIESVKFLIDNHLLIYTAMTKKDIENIEVITEIATKVDGLANLEKLIILSFCDMKATNPNALNAWNYELLKILYQRVRKHIEGDVSYTKPENIKLWAKDNNRNYFDELDLIISNLPSPYLRYHSHVEIYDTAMLMFDMYESGVLKISFEPKTIAGYGLLRIAMPGDTAGLFYKINSVLSYYGASVIYASVHTMKNGAVFDLFRIGGTVIYDRSRMKKLKEKLENVLLEKESIEPIVQTCFISNSISKQNIIVKFETTHKSYAKMELECNDRNNLLTDLSSIFIEFNLNINFAKISTFGNIAVDMFHLSQKALKPDEDILDKLKNRLLEVL